MKKFNKEDRFKLYVNGTLTKNELNIQLHESAKILGVPIENIQIFSTGNEMEIISEVIEDKLSSVTGLHNLYEEWLNKCTDVEKEEFYKIDQKVNIKFEEKTNKSNYKILYVRGKNIRSFGEFQFNFFEYSDLLLINSTPQNYGGKTNFFKLFDILLWGKCRKTDEWAKLDETVNIFANKNDTYFIEGIVEVCDKSYFLRRDYFVNKAGTVSHKFKLYLITDEKTANSFIEIENDNVYFHNKDNHNRSMDGHWAINLTEETAHESLKVYQREIGDIEENLKISHFNAENIYELLMTKPSERTRNFFNLFGGDFFTKKKEEAKVLHKSFLTNSKIKTYDPSVILQSIDDLGIEMVELNSNLDLILIEKERVEQTINQLNINTETLKESLKKIPQSPTDIFYLKSELESLEKIKVNYAGKIKECTYDLSFEEKISTIKTQLSELNHKYNEELIELRVKIIEVEGTGLSNYKAYVDLHDTYKTKSSLIENFIKEKEVILKELDNIGTNLICGKCGQPVKNRNEEKNTLNKRLQEIIEELESCDTNPLLNKLKILESNFNARKNNALIQYKKNESENKSLHDINKKELEQEIISLESQKEIFQFNETIIAQIETVDLKISNVTEKIVLFNTHIADIKHNENVQAQISLLKEKESLEKSNLVLITRNYDVLKSTQQIKRDQIAHQKAILEQIKGDIIIDKAFKLYVEAHDKDGIINNLMLNYIGVINEELDVIMGDLPFKCYVVLEKGIIDYIIENNETKYNLKNGSGMEKCASMLALNLVQINFSKINIPNYIRIDEIFGPIGGENIEIILKILERYKSVFEKCFIISHREDIKDAFLNAEVLTIKKEGKISKLC